MNQPIDPTTAKEQIAAAKAEGRLEAEIEMLRAALTDLRLASLHQSAATEEQRAEAKIKLNAAIERADRVMNFFAK